jgi:spermidine/putrescine-binding protein
VINQESPSQRFTRRELLRLGGAAAAALGAAPVLAACGSSGSSSSSPSPGAGSSASVAGTVNFFSWQGYDLLDIAAMKTFRKKNNITLHSTYIANSNDPIAKFTTGGGKGIYNLGTYDAGYGPSWSQLGILSAVDLAKVPNFRNVYPIFQHGPVSSRWWHFNGQQWGFPFTWGVQGINYQANKIAAPTSYRDLLAPSYKNKIGVMDDVVAAVTIGAHVLGIFRVDSLYTKSQLAQIIAFWAQMKKNARLVISSYGNMGDLLASGEIVAATPGWAAVNSFAAAKGDHNVKHVVPKEGSATFCDAFMIPQGSNDVETVYAYINAALSPEAQAQEAANLVQGVVNPSALPLMDAATRALYPYDQITQIFSTSAPLEAIPTQVASGYTSFNDWNVAWEAFKAG